MSATPLLHTTSLILPPDYFSNPSDPERPTTWVVGFGEDGKEYPFHRDGHGLEWNRGWTDASFAAFRNSGRFRA